MRHIDDRTLDQLLEDSLGEQQEHELEAHIQHCPPCAARLREWEALFPQIRGVAPAGEDAIGATELPATRSSVVILPDWTPPVELPRAPRARPTPLWVVVAVLALVAAWLALRGRGTREEGPNLAINEPGLPNVDTMAGGLGSGLGDSTRRSAVAESAAALGVQYPAPESLTAPDTRYPLTPAVADSENRPAVARPEDTVQFPIIADRDPTETPDPAPARPTEFTRVTLGDAIERLGGPVRVIEGLSPEAVEVAGGSVLPGADPGRLVVRIIYNGPDGRIILDQQRLSRPGPREPDIAITTAQSGVSVAQWIDWKGYWISLASRTSQESLLAIANRIRESQ